MGWCTTQCKMLLFYVKPIIKESPYFELAHLKKVKKKEKHFGDFQSPYFCDATRLVVDHEALEIEWYCVIKFYKFTCCQMYIPSVLVLRHFFWCYRILRVCAIPTYRVYHDSQIQCNQEQ